MNGWGVTTELIAGNLGWGEGPVHVPSERAILFSDINASTIHRWRDGAVSVYRRPSNRTNGNTIDREGRLISCEHQSRRVVRTEHDGAVRVLADSYGGRRLNSPNDVAVASDGGIWFTDPPYGLLHGDAGADAKQEIDTAGVYRLDPETGRLEAKIDVLDKPNGIVFSPDGRHLYVSDTGYSERPEGNHHIFRFDLRGNTPLGMTVFKAIVPGACDGLRIDGAGNIWSTAGDGVHCYAADGTEVGRIDLGEMTTNLCFLPGSDERGVFVTTPTRAIVCRLAGDRAADGFCRDPARSKP